MVPKMKLMEKKRQNGLRIYKKKAKKKKICSIKI